MSTILDSIELLGELDQIEDFDESEHGKFFVEKGNDTRAPITKENRNRTKNEIWEAIESKAEKLAQEKGIREDLATTQVLENNPEIYRKIRNLTNPQNKYRT